MPEVIGVRFKKVGKVYYFDPDGTTVKNGQQVIVETSRGVECGEVVMPNREMAEEQITAPLKKLLRIANSNDLKTLEERGLIEREKGFNRCIKLSKAEKSTHIPVLGRVTAGVPILAVEEIETYIPVSESLRRGRELFALRVMGESMINAGILDGDIIVIQKCEYAENGQIIAALVNNEATVKTFYKENGHFRLQPENSTMEPIIVNEVIVLGKVIACLRYY